jgi:predicted transcriptional regulator
LTALSDDGIVVGGGVPVTCYNSGMSADNEKPRALEAIQALPDSATLEEVIERLCFLAKIEEGLRQSEAGQVVSHNEVVRRFGRQPCHA